MAQRPLHVNDTLPDVPGAPPPQLEGQPKPLRPMTSRLVRPFHVKHIGAGYGLVIDQVTDALFHVQRTRRRTAMYGFYSRDSMPKDSEASHGPARTIGSEFPTGRELAVLPCAATATGDRQPEPNIFEDGRRIASRSLGPASSPRRAQLVSRTSRFGDAHTCRSRIEGRCQPPPSPL